MNKKRIWEILTLGVVFILVISVSPEVRLLGMFIEVIGLDMFVLLFEVQILAILLASYHRLLRPIIMRVNALLERLDPFYFISSSATLRACPAMIMHSVPFLVSFYLIVFLGISAYS
ncbi:MAG: hypothetical protein Q7T44_17445 [Parvibaculum sp.]|nr:hypothetical protein [Parvibaculum sp.]